ncbi:uncharacterized protein LOC134816713 isoform X2 [Bolinopsis microptera]|uniref:uncharacterized protein LOC134816713 isoform X2 n=1 Tax=Bolinopsis microptera TaxID=2820187 RepID=UPI003079918F
MKTAASESARITPEFLKKNCILRIPSQTGETKYECVLCKTKRLTDLTLITHVANLKHSEIVKRREDGADKYTDTKYHGRCLQHSLECLLEDRCGGVEEYEKRVEVVSELESIFQHQSKSFPVLEGVAVEIYGSSAFNVALKTSDINCFLRVKEYLLCVKTVTEIITQYDELYETPTITSGHKFPRIRFLHKQTGFSILMSVHSPKSENFTTLMNHLLACDEKALQLARLMKIHCEEMNLTDGTFANHVFYIMTVYFAQHTKPPLLPKFVKDYDHLMSKSEEDRCNREERLQRREKEKLKLQEQQKKEINKEKNKRSSQDIAIENFAAAAVKDSLKLSLIQISIEDGVSITAEEIERIMKEARVDSIFPEITIENDPWNAGGVVCDAGESAWNGDVSCHNSHTQPSSSAATEGGAAVEQEIIPSLEALSLEPAEHQEKGKQPPVVEKKERYSNKEEKGVDWNGVEEQTKIKLSKWGDQYMDGIRAECYSWESVNDKELHSLFQEMVRFFAKFSFENSTISICRSSDDTEHNKYSFVEDPFQPGTSLYNIPQSGKSKKNKKVGRNRIYHDMTRHVKAVYEILRHYYEGPHKAELCLASPGYENGRQPPYSPFEFAIRYEIPPPFSDDHRQPPQEKLPGIEKVTEGAVNALDRIVDKITEKYKLSDQDNRAREQTFSELGDLVRRQVNPSIRPLWFGSSRNGLVLNTSDMDITLDVTKLGPVDPTHILSELAKQIKKNKLFILDEVILAARVPIVKFRRTDNDLTGDIAVGNMLAIANTRLIKAYTEIDERVPRLGLLVKAVVKNCECADASTGSLSSYAYTMMVIYFLQQLDPPVIPVLQEINRPRDLTVYEEEGWDTYFYSDVHQQTSDWPCENVDSVALLALKFFKFYYEEFDYSKNVIAPKQKAHLLCTDKNWFRPINIEDPFNLDHNLGKQVSAKTFDVIKTVFRQAYLRYSVGPLDRTDHTLRYYMEKSFLLDGKKPPVNFICFGCGSRDHYISECPNKNRCSHCNEPDHSKSSCPKIECFHCKGYGHIGKSCPNKKHGNHGNSPYKRISPDKNPSMNTDYYDRKNWIGQAMKPADVQIGKSAPPHFKQHPKSPAVHRVINHDYRFNGDQKEGGRRAPRSMSESSEVVPSSRKNNKKKKRTSSETKERADSLSENTGLFLGDQDFVPLKQWSDPVMEPENKTKSNEVKVLHVKTKDVKENKKQGASSVENNPQDKLKQSTHMTFMGGSVTTPIPQHAKEDSRQKKSKSMVRKDMFGDQKPKASAVNTSNKKQNVKTSKVKAPSAPGTGKKATKTELWEDTGVEIEGSRYGPKREDDEYAGDLAPDFFSTPANYIHEPDPNNLSEWGDLTPSLEADSVLGASLQKEIGQPDWIGYLSSSPEKPIIKPQSRYTDQPRPPPPPPQQQSYMEQVPFHSPPKNMASKQLLDQLHNSPHKGAGQRRDEGDHSAKSGGKHRNKQSSGYQDPYLVNNNKRKNNRSDNVVSEERYRDHHQDSRQHRNDHHRREEPRDGNYRDPGYQSSPRKNYRDEMRGGYNYHDDPRAYQDNARGYHDNSRGYDARGEMHYRERPRDFNDGNPYGDERGYGRGAAPNSFMGPTRPGYQPPPHPNRPTNEPPNFDALKRRPGKGRGARGRN